MPEARQPMICDRCGGVMNHHADKLVDPVGAQQTAKADPTLGGMVQEMYACPACGNVDSRPGK